MSIIDELEVNLERLEHHLDAVYSGSLIARDDLASVLQMLTHSGEGYALINKALAEQNLPMFNMPAHTNSAIARTHDGKNVILAVRSINSDPSIQMPFSDVLSQEAVFHDNSTWTSASSLTWAQIIAKSRNQHGAHVDNNPIQWLEDLRIYPIANADVMTFLLWSFGEALLEAITHHLASQINQFMLYERRKALNGVEIQLAHLLSVPPTSIEVGADVMVTDEYSGQRTVFGGVYNSIPFVMGLMPSRQIAMLRGDTGQNLEDLESHFILGSSGDRLNRAQRRAARRNK